jgi:hypothetical protein
MARNETGKGSGGASLVSFDGVLDAAGGGDLVA